MLKSASSRAALTDRTAMLRISLIVVLANLAMFSFPDAIFWDDWTLFGTPQEDLVRYFTEAGSPQAGYINWALTLLGPGGVRALVFGMGLLSVLLWFQILRITPNISLSSLALSVALATSFPFFLARVATINTISVMALVIFLFGWLKSLEGAVSQDRKISVLGFFSVFFSGVLYSAYIPMLSLVILHVALVFSRSQKEVPWRKLVSVTTVLFFVHGIALYAQRQIFPPHGTYDGYRTILFGEDQFTLLIAGLGALLMFIVPLFRRRNARSTGTRWASFEMALLGVIALLLAISPYALIGSFPPYQEWQTRYELNYFIPATLFLVAIFGWLEATISGKALNLTGALLVLTTIMYSNFLLSRFHVDWQKHDVVIEVLGANKDKVAGKFVVFIDETGALNAMGRSVRTYEWSGILSEATGTRDTFGVSAQDYHATFSSYLNGDLDSDLNRVYNYKWEDHTFPNIGVLVRITAVDYASCGPLEFSVSECLSVEIFPDPPSY